MDIELEKLKKLEEALSDCVDILQDCQVDKTCDNCKHSDLPRGYEPCVYCRNKDDWEPKESPCPCEDGIDSKVCVGCEHSEDGNPHPFENYHCYICDKSDKKYRPYKSCAEMIMDFIDRFKVNCPSYCEPLIWLSLKEDERNRFLVTGFHEDSIEITKQLAPMDMSCVFEKFVYLDGSPVGVEVKE